MDEIRRNYEQETEIISAQFTVPKILKITYGILVSIFAIVAALGIVLVLIDELLTGIFLIMLGIVAMLMIAIFFVCQIKGIKNSSCTVTNKRIKGVISVFIAKKTFSYKLDEIENVEIGSSFGQHTLALHFLQGNGTGAAVGIGSGVALSNGGNVFRITYVSNVQELYEKLSDVLTGVKSEKDVMIDIEKKKIEAENKKADAFAAMAANIGVAQSGVGQSAQSDYIAELKRLKELLDSGVITQQEFDAKKKELLG